MKRFWGFEFSQTSLIYIFTDSLLFRIELCIRRRLTQCFMQCRSVPGRQGVRLHWSKGQSLSESVNSHPGVRVFGGFMPRWGGDDQQMELCRWYTSQWFTERVGRSELVVLWDPGIEFCNFTGTIMGPTCIYLEYFPRHTFKGASSCDDIDFSFNVFQQ